MKLRLIAALLLTMMMLTACEDDDCPAKGGDGADNVARDVNCK